MAEILFCEDNEGEWDYPLKTRLRTGNAIVYCLSKIFLLIADKNMLPISVHRPSCSYTCTYAYTYVFLNCVCVCFDRQKCIYKFKG